MNRRSITRPARTVPHAAAEAADPRLPPRRLNRAFALAVVGVLSLGTVVRAADPGITVSGSGEAKAKPTSVEMSATVGAEAELTADAVVKFNDARKKAMDALTGLKMAGLTIEPGGMSVGSAVDAQQQMRVMNGMAQNAKAPKTRVAEDLKLVIGGIDKLKPGELTDAIMKVVDTGRDAGLSIGPKQPSSYYEAQMMAQMGGGSAIAQFRLDDADSVRDQAYQLAIKDAKAKAEKLASLAGVTLGPVISIQEAPANANDGSNLRMAIIEAETGMSGAKNTNAALSPKMGDIPVKVNVTVQFAINK